MINFAHQSQITAVAYYGLGLPTLEKCAGIVM